MALALWHAKLLLLCLKSRGSRIVLKRVLSILGVYKAYEKWLLFQVKNYGKPEHVAIILDGNRRWANEKEVNPWLGHKKGAETGEQVRDWGEGPRGETADPYT